ncbi:hypothetical protein [Synechococcus sp. A15-44]|uniref:hypothetical protein n=1 Tax=Synechococcus sp. A15-44 TaxID=1050646 RepID=UPI00164890E9|nr:hypothetical protein [Synechococcus sp. A15-44]QNI65664.1 hypothetical protein SynA1544_02748 [Synechococcus sp. A15-44]
MPTITTGDLEVVFPKVAKEKIEVAELDVGTEIVALKYVTDLETTVTGDAAFVGKGVAESSVVLKSTKENTPKLVFQNNAFNKSNIKISGKGAGNIKSNTGAFANSKITGGKRGDSVKFGNKSIVNNATIVLGKGGDSITFGKRTTFKGKTIVNVTPGGKDVVTFGKNLKSQSGSVVIKNFDKQDKLTVGNDTFTYKQIKNGVDIPGITIKLA